MTTRAPLQVFLTVDTELWPGQPAWPGTALPRDKRFDDEIATDFHGQTSRGGYGLPYQIGVFNHYGLQATYFVESLFDQRVGAGTLAHVAGLVQAGGHDVQLHLHTEWLGELDDPELPDKPCQYMCQLTLEQQSALIRSGLRRLAGAGVPRVQAFRAGSYGANLDTLRALARNGIAIDSSYNPTHLPGDWGGRRIAGPQQLEHVWEFPVASFRDFPGHTRHAQLCAVSFAEMKRALLHAWKADWPSFVIVLHSFELLCRQGPDRLATPNGLAIRRFEQLCALLGDRPEQFQTTLFSRLALPPATSTACAAQAPALAGLVEQVPLYALLPATLWRMAEQAWSNLG